MDLAPNYRNNGTDPYGVLGLPYAFYLDLNVIEEAFRRTAALHHPDQAGGSTASFHELQEAAAILRDPAKRLRRLAGISEPRTLPLPSAATELFPIVIACLQKTDELVKNHQAASGALARALLHEKLLREHQSIQKTLEQIKNWESALQQQLQAWDSTQMEPAAEELLELANQFTFSQRWLQQLRERELTLKTLVE